jgi:hypothetical protein
MQRKYVLDEKHLEDSDIPKGKWPLNIGKIVYTIEKKTPNWNEALFPDHKKQGFSTQDKQPKAQ